MTVSKLAASVCRINNSFASYSWRFKRWQVLIEIIELLDFSVLRSLENQIRSRRLHFRRE
jgi:hypothetical protein